MNSWSLAEIHSRVMSITNIKTQTSIEHILCILGTQKLQYR